ncbi:Bile acid-CoA hydrolase [compost metagenome]
MPATPYHTLDSLLEDPHLKDIGFFELKDHPTEGRTRVMRSPNKWSTSMRREWNPAPKLGQHSVEILREIGYSDADIDSMITGGVTMDGRLKKP